MPYNFFYSFHNTLFAKGLFNFNSSENTPAPPLTEERITEEGEERITEDGQIRITE